MLEQIGPYKIGKTIGRGGLGVVYRAVDTRNGADVALKLLRQPAEDAISARRMAREFRALQGLEHPHVVRVLDAGVHEEIPFLVMEYIDGIPLRGWLDTTFDDPGRPKTIPPAVKRPSEPEPDLESAAESVTMSVDLASLPWEADDEPESVPSHMRVRVDESKPGESVVLPASARLSLNRPVRIRKLRSVFLQLADALSFVHSRGLVHRDLKPSNVLVCEGGQAKLLDFGLVKSGDGGGTTAAGRLVGTFRYMSPEQARGETVDTRSDLFSLGSMLYEMLCGRPPFTDRQTAALLSAIVSQPPPDPERVNPEVDRKLASIAMRLLQKARDARYPDAEALAAALKD